MGSLCDNKHREPVTKHACLSTLTLWMFPSQDVHEPGDAQALTAVSGVMRNDVKHIFLRPILHFTLLECKKPRSVLDSDQESTTLQLLIAIYPHAVAQEDVRPISTQGEVLLGDQAAVH
jgi:hypothetical protein